MDLKKNEDADENKKRLTILIEVLTHSGSTSLDEEVLKEIKKICRY